MDCAGEGDLGERERVGCEVESEVERSLDLWWERNMPKGFVGGLWAWRV